MKNFFASLLVATSIFASQSFAVTADTVEFDYLQTAIFMANSNVTQLIQQASQAQGGLYVNKIVTGTPTAVEQASIPAHTTDICVELWWFGGDTLAPYGTIRGSVLSQHFGRGQSIHVESARLIEGNQPCE